MYVARIIELQEGYQVQIWNESDCGYYFDNQYKNFKSYEHALEYANKNANSFVINEIPSIDF